MPSKVNSKKSELEAIAAPVTDAAKKETKKAAGKPVISESIVASSSSWSTVPIGGGRFNNCQVLYSSDSE